eukprot:TRINITY_DN539_c0_g1_i4.p1 TRINITY_DN539_c0_g1~~TRINITY_DN539_c0_g1_i4.p1  ORF type:complete len:555 (+),score=188.60 TRINITY_DN539_c0_g1_i4:57-1667(+)
MDIPLKVTFTRRGDIECMRRVTLYNPSLQVVYDRVKEWSKGSFELGYKDDEGDIIAMDTEVEWEECVRLWKEIVNKSDNKFAPLRLEAKKTKPHREHREKKQREAAANDPVAAPQQQTIQQTEDVVDQILTFIMGEDMRNSLVLGVVSPADFGLDSWLKISHYQINNNGQRHVDADLVKLNRFLQRRGIQSLQQTDFLSAVRWFQFQTQLSPSKISYYNLACSHSCNLNCEDALTAFEKSLELGYKSLKHIVDDADLDPLREVPEFTQIMTKYFGSAYEEEMAKKLELDNETNGVEEPTEKPKPDETNKIAQDMVQMLLGEKEYKKEDEHKIRMKKKRLEEEQLAAAIQKAEEESIKKAIEDKLKAEREAAEARLKAAEEERLAAEREAAEARLKAAEEERLAAEREAIQKAEEESRKKVIENRLKAEQEAVEARLKAAEEEALKNRIKAEEEAAKKLQAEKEAKKRERAEAARKERVNREVELRTRLQRESTSMKYPQQISSLKAMGFKVDGRLLDILRKYEGSIEQTLSELVSS